MAEAGNIDKVHRAWLLQCPGATAEAQAKQATVTSAQSLAALMSRRNSRGTGNRRTELGCFDGRRNGRGTGTCKAGNSDKRTDLGCFDVQALRQRQRQQAHRAWLL